MNHGPEPRRNRRVALVTDDFRIYHELAPFFLARGLPLVGLPPGAAIPESVQVVLAGPVGDARSIALQEGTVANWLAVVQALDPRIEGPYRRVVVGLDPGQTMGAAVLADGAVLWYDDLFDPDECGATIKQWLAGLEADEIAVHLGNGAPSVGRRMRASLRAAQLPCYTVPEHRSTPQSPRTKSRHTDAAIRIAMRTPWADA